MYELVQVGEYSYYIECPARIGLVRLSEREVCLIDSGNDKDAGRKVLKILNENGWNLSYILNTHSHADHIGGNKYLQSKTGCNIYSQGIECDFTNHPVLEPSFLYGGFAPKNLRHKFLMAKESDALPLEVFELSTVFKEIIPLHGHSFDMVGFRTKDDVVYLADSIFSEATMDKYKINFLYDVQAHLSTLERLNDIEGKMFVPAHVEPTDSIKGIVRKNIENVNEVAENIEKLCENPASFEEILQKLFYEYNLKMTAEQYFLVGNTVKSYLAWLKNTEKIDLIFQDNILFWIKK